MPKSTSAALKTHQAGTTTTMARLMKIVRTDSVSFFFTSHDEDILWAGDTYVAVGGFTNSAIKANTGLSVDNLEVQTILDSAGFTEDDIIAGLFDFATFEIFDVNYKSLGDGRTIRRTGIIGEYRHNAPSAQIELRGLMQYLQQRVGRLLMKKCDADLGDTRCGVVLASFTVTGLVTSVASRIQFNVDTPPAAAGGLFTFTSGNNNNLSMEVRTVSGNTIQLVQPIPYDIAVNDTYSVYRGCSKTPAICNSVFNNIVNHRGIPFLPGNDEIFRYPDAR